jgi:hypothetical protein
VYSAIAGSKEIAVYPSSGRELQTRHSERRLVDLAERLD